MSRSRLFSITITEPTQPSAETKPDKTREEKGDSIDLSDIYKPRSRSLKELHKVKYTTHYGTLFRQNKIADEENSSEKSL